MHLQDLQNPQDLQDLQDLQPPEPPIAVPITAVPITALRLATTIVHGRRVVTVAGEIDIATAQELYNCLCDALQAATGKLHASKVVSVDLSAVTFMDACGLTALLRAETHTQGARLHLTALTPRTTRLLRMTGLDRHFTLCPTSHDDQPPNPNPSPHHPGQPGDDSSPQPQQRRQEQDPPD